MYPYFDNVFEKERFHFKSVEVIKELPKHSSGCDSREKVNVTLSFGTIFFPEAFAQFHAGWTLRDEGRKW